MNRSVAAGVCCAALLAPVAAWGGPRKKSVKQVPNPLVWLAASRKNLKGAADGVASAQKVQDGDPDGRLAKVAELIGQAQTELDQAIQAQKQRK